jgi:Lar family restriction alleviation protein
MSQSELKPCPFCGEPAIVVCNKYRHDQFLFSVQCGNTRSEGLDTCPVIPSTYEYTEKTDAIDAWNRRHNENN